jgi:hypothetical protein
MSEQNQSNFQAFGAGLFGFVAVMAIGGGALMVRSSQQAKAGARPEAAAAPIDLGSSMPRPSLSPISAQKERRAQSPAPLTGEVQEEAEAPEAPAAESSGSAATSSSRSAPNAQTPASRLEVTQHLDKPGSGSSATAIVTNTLAPEEAPKAAAKKPLDKKAALKIDTAGAVASVHYGVTNRNELMGRAAGPVYNIKGGSGKGGSGEMGKMAADVNAKISDLQKQLEAAGLPAEHRAKLQQDLDNVMKGVVGPSMTAEPAKAAQ